MSVDQVAQSAGAAAQSVADRLRRVRGAFVQHVGAIRVGDPEINDIAACSRTPPGAAMVIFRGGEQRGLRGACRRTWCRRFR
ncbi:hypothetical protein HD597_003879 [Nonomuraea thailandensis]|uniref:Uncharacterized protein n=1 Tax=Nonomuraea thailandensis TaxID=1188745 RepID=A0A9X2K200_9ACTN|nr:hypothetical protein [Nonomuraea thailandensis]MCP2356859.1 hypothetical protein [Nonomuraea thailandensis]